MGVIRGPCVDVILVSSRLVLLLMFDAALRSEKRLMIFFANQPRGLPQTPERHIPASSTRRRNWTCPCLVYEAGWKIPTRYWDQFSHLLGTEIQLSFRDWKPSDLHLRPFPSSESVFDLICRVSWDQSGEGLLWDMSFTRGLLRAHSTGQDNVFYSYILYSLYSLKILTSRTEVQAQWDFRSPECKYALKKLRD